MAVCQVTQGTLTQSRLLSDPVQVTCGEQSNSYVRQSLVYCTSSCTASRRVFTFADTTVLVVSPSLPPSPPLHPSLSVCLSLSLSPTPRRSRHPPPTPFSPQPPDMAAVRRRADPPAPVSSIINEMTRPVSDILGGAKLDPLDDPIPRKHPPPKPRTANPPPRLPHLRSSVAAARKVGPGSPATKPTAKKKAEETAKLKDDKVLDMMRPFCQSLDELLPGGKVSGHLGPLVGAKKRTTAKGKPVEDGEVDELEDVIRPVTDSPDSRSLRKKRSRGSRSSAREERGNRFETQPKPDKEHPPVAKKRRRADDSSARAASEKELSPPKRAKTEPDREKERRSTVSKPAKETLTIPRKARKAEGVSITGLRSRVTPSPASESSLDQTHEGSKKRARNDKQERTSKRKDTDASPRPEKRKKTEKEGLRRSTVRLASKPIPESMLNSERQRSKAGSARSERDKPECGGQRERDVIQGHSERERSRERDQEHRDHRYRRRDVREPKNRDGTLNRDSDRERTRLHDGHYERKRDDSRERTRDRSRDRDTREKDGGISREEEAERSLRRSTSKNDGDSGESTRVLDEENHRDSEFRATRRRGKDSDNHKEHVEKSHAPGSRQSSAGGSTEVAQSPENEATGGGQRPRFHSQPVAKESAISQMLTSSPKRTRPAKVELGCLLAKRKRLNKDFFAAKNQLKGLIEEKEYDAFEETARTAFRLAFEIALSKESELRLSEKELRNATSSVMIDRKRDIIDHYKYLTKKLAPNCIADLEKIGRKRATSYFERGIQKAYLRQFALQRLWEKDQRKRETNVKRAVVDAIKSQRDGGGGKSAEEQFSTHQLQSLKEVSDGYCNIISVLETAVRDLGDGCEEAGNECHMQ